VTNAQERHLLTEEEFIAGFHAIGEERYHHKHPFHKLMHEGALTRGLLYIGEGSNPHVAAGSIPDVA